MSPPREHPGSDATFAELSRFGDLRSRSGGATGTTELSIDDVLGSALDTVDSLDTAPSDQAELDEASRTDEVSADELLGWFTPDEPTDGNPQDESSDGGQDGGDRLPVLAAPAFLLGDVEAPAVLRPAGPRGRFLRRRFGAAPFIKPSARRSRRKRRRDYRQLGFVELTPEKLRLRHRILPRTVLGASFMLLALGVGAAFSGASFYAYYDWKVSKSEAQSQAFAQGFEQTFTNAQEQLELTRNQAIEQINGNLEPLREWTKESTAVAELPAKVGGGVFFVRTMDTAGKPSVGSAFVVSSSPTESLLLTSYQVVAALTAKPGPPLTLEKGSETFPAELWAWDADHDLALLKTSRGSLPQLEWAPDAERAHTAGKRVFAIAGWGGQGATAAPGLAVDASQVGIRHDTPLSPEFRGGPLTNSGGQVLGLVSTGYTPTGVDAGELTFAPFITSACERVLRCPDAVTATSAPAAAPAPVGATVPTSPSN